MSTLDISITLHPMHARCLAFFTAALFALPGCSSDGSKPVADGGADAGGVPKIDFASYDAAISAFLVDHGLKGASGVVVHKDYGIVHVQGYGDYPPDRLYLVASSSKVVSVGVLMRLADMGKL